jgi:hypothetical protein
MARRPLDRQRRPSGLGNNVSSHALAFRTSGVEAATGTVPLGTAEAQPAARDPAAAGLASTTSGFGRPWERGNMRAMPEPVGESRSVVRVALLKVPFR